MPGTAARLVDVTFGYGDGPPVVDRMSLEVPAGEFTGIIGANGSGKTTSLRLLSGVLEPASGSVEVFGRPCGGYARKELARLVGVVPQNAAVPFAFSVRDVVAMGRFARQERFKGATPEDAHAVERSMAMTDVLDFADRTLNELSGGERQRVIIARALAAEPELLLLDEPTSFLDINHQVEIFELLVRLNRDSGLTVLTVSHDLNLAAEYCRRLVMCRAGHVECQGPAAEVMTADNLRRAFGCEVGVERNAVTGAPMVLLTRKPQDETVVLPRIHVVCGGGSGAGLIRRLVFRGHPVTAGVLNGGDSDAAAAEGLGVPVALEKPFAPLGDAALEQNRALMREADAVVVASVCWGPGNLANLRQVADAAAEGARVLVADTGELQDYTGTGGADALFERLKEYPSVTFYSTVAAVVDTCAFTTHEL